MSLIDMETVSGDGPTSSSQAIPPLLATAPPIALLEVEGSGASQRDGSLGGGRPVSSAQAPGIPTAGLMEPSTPLAQEIYDEVVHWRKSFFKIPCGSVGKELVNELSSYINKYVQSGGDDTDALFYFSILPVLTLQRTAAKCTDKENSGHLQRRMRLWKSNDIQSLLEESRSLQRSTGGRASGNRKRGQDDAARRFADCMTADRVNEALKSLQPESTAGTLKLEDVVTSSDGSQATVRQLLQEKHLQRRLPPRRYSCRVPGRTSTQSDSTRSRPHYCETRHCIARARLDRLVLIRLVGEGCALHLKAHRQICAMHCLDSRTSLRVPTLHPLAWYPFSRADLWLWTHTRLLVQSHKTRAFLYETGRFLNILVDNFQYRSGNDAAQEFPKLSTKMFKKRPVSYRNARVFLRASKLLFMPCNAFMMMSLARLFFW